MRKGFTLVELLVGFALVGLITSAMLSLMAFNGKSMTRSGLDADLAQQNAQALRRVADTLRSAAVVSISNDANTVTYQLPRLAGTVDPVTGEREYIVPIVGDGVTRTFVVTGGRLVDGNGRVLVRNVAATDPERGSSQFGQRYQPFQLSTIESRRAVTVTLITQSHVMGEARYVRLKTTAFVRNSQ